MLRYVYGDELSDFPGLRDSMFEDRTRQFRDRLGWAVQVDARGWERDDYDAINPLYVIWQTAEGRHGGSMRFLPTVGQTMVNDHFLHLCDGVPIQSPLIWECTRFCLADGVGAHVSAALMLGGAEIGLGHHLDHAVGVFDARMVRIYRRLGWCPEVIGQTGNGHDAVAVGLWEFSVGARDLLAKKAGISLALSRLWFDRAFSGRAKLAAVG